ncbi:MAG TPA: CHAT domain-containing protein, partial [Cyclobacteriaceae bacterium]|nr:CHAT domain-containing protein [Cyclobacteriaceae bacterium]
TRSVITQGDGRKRPSRIITDKKKALDLSKELLKMVDQSKVLQTYSNYYILKTIFETQTPDAELAKKCKEKADEKMAEMTSTVTNYTPAANDANGQWNYVFMPDLFSTKHPDNAEKGMQFLIKNPGLQSYNNFTFVAYAFERNGDFQKAKESYEKAMSLRGDDKTEFYSYSYYANFLSRSGEYLKAEDLLSRMERLSTEAVEMFRVSYKSEAMNSRVSYYLSIGDYSSYVQAANASYDYFSTTMKTADICDPYPLLRFTVTAHAREMLKQYGDAERLWAKRDSSFTTYLDCNKKKFPKMQQPMPLSMLPVYQIKLGKRKELKQPVAYYLKETEDHYASYKEYADLSINYMKAVQLGFLGGPSYHQAFKSVLDQIIATRNFRESTTPFAYYAWFNVRDHRYEQAAGLYDQLYSINVGWINDIIFSFGEKAFVSYYNAKLKDGYDDYHSLVKIAKVTKPALFPHVSSQAYNNLLFTKSLSLKGTQKRKKAFQKANDPAIVRLYEEWIAKKEQLIRLYRKAEDAASAESKVENTVNPEELKKLQVEVDHLENELVTKAKDFEKYLKITPPDWKSVRNKLKDDEAAVEMVRFQWRNQVYYSDSAYYAAYIITKNSTHPDVVYLPAAADELDNRFYKAYQNAIRFKVEDKDSYNRFWKPIQNQLKGIRKIYFSPDGIYHLISLPTLFNPESGKYLLDETEIHYTTGTADIQSGQDESFRSAVLMGRPAYKIEKTQPVVLAKADHATRAFVRNFRDNAINDLPGTEEEVNTIKAEMDKQGVKSEFYIHEKATEDKLYELHSPDILHIATHGYWSEAGDAATDGYRAFNAMANSGLLLSGVVNYYSNTDYPDTYDGILTAYEAQNLELENTSLVILSACETSLGHLDAGEGVYGLQRAFRAAGAKSIMTSLWKVDDDATKEFMISFYSNLLKTKNKSGAFQDAQRSLKAKYPEPYYWGAFVLTGN